MQETHKHSTRAIRSNDSHIFGYAPENIFQQFLPKLTLQKHNGRVSKEGLEWWLCVSEYSWNGMHVWVARVDELHVMNTLT